MESSIPNADKTTQGSRFFVSRYLPCVIQVVGIPQFMSNERQSLIFPYTIHRPDLLQRPRCPSLYILSKKPNPSPRSFPVNSCPTFRSYANSSVRLLSIQPTCLQQRPKLKASLMRMPWVCYLPLSFDFGIPANDAYW